MKKHMKFEEALSRLEEIVSLLSDQATTLDQALKLYGEASELSAFCSSKLEDARLQMETIGQKNVEESVDVQ
jgi:exodeoxyribonuclease VII small subunit